jgi:hypothetical protein
LHKCKIITAGKYLKYLFDLGLLFSHKQNLPYFAVICERNGAREKEFFISDKIDFCFY